MNDDLELQYKWFNKRDLMGPPPDFSEENYKTSFDLVTELHHVSIGMADPSPLLRMGELRYIDVSATYEDRFTDDFNEDCLTKEMYMLFSDRQWLESRLTMHGLDVFFNVYTDIETNENLLTLNKTRVELMDVDREFLKELEVDLIEIARLNYIDKKGRE